METAGGQEKNMRVSQLAKYIGIPTEWVVGLCVAVNAPGVTGEDSMLSAEWCRKVRNFYWRTKKNGANGCHAPDDRLKSAWPTLIPANTRQPAAGQDGNTVPPGEVRRITAKARNLIENEHYDCVLMVLYAQIDRAMRARLTPEQLANNKAIEMSFGGPNDAVLRDDLHRMRILANIARHDGVAPTRYEAERALQVYIWLFGPQGEFGQPARMKV